MPFFSPPPPTFVFQLVQTLPYIVVCVCVCLVKMDGQQTAFGRHAVRERFNVPFYPSLPYTSVPIRWFVCDLHFVFPSTVAPKTRKTYVGKIRKKNKGRRTQLFLSGGLRWMCAGFSHTRVKFTQLLVTPPTAGEKKRRNYTLLLSH